MLIKYTVTYDSGEYSFEFLQGVSPALGTNHANAKLALDYHSFNHVKEQLKNADLMRVYVKAALLSASGHRLDESQVTIELDKEKWILAQQEDNKPSASGILPNHQGTPLLDNTTSVLREEITKIKQTLAKEDPILQLQKKAFEGQVNAIKEYLLEQPEMKQLKDFEPVLEICSKMHIDPRWAIAAALLSSLEGYMKNWLVSNAGEKLEDLKKKEFDELISKIQKTLLAKKISFQQKKLSDLAGKRHLRNQVLHEMYVPSDDEIKEIKDESVAFVKYLDSLIT